MAGASAEDIGRSVLESMAAGLEAIERGGSPDDILDLVETVAGVLADAGVRPEDVGEAMRAALAAAGGNAELAEELTKSLARALAAVGADGGEVEQRVRDALEEQGFSRDKVARLTLEAVASSGSAPEDVAAAMHRLITDTGMTIGLICVHLIIIVPLLLVPNNVA
jgi:uncharacterized protein related to proFAR isomerase